MDPRVRRVVEKLTEAREKGLSCFGSDSHRFTLAPPLPIESLRAFEAEHGVTLPEAYATFVTQVGASGAGPYYGLLPLSDWADAMPDAGPGTLAAPCALSPDGRAEADAPDAERLRGTLTLVSQGCAYYALLVVTGPHAGRVVYVSCDDLAKPYFVENPDFLSWYERWLDELLAGYDDFWFGFGMPGTEAELAAAVREGRRRADALDTLRRLPRLSSATAELVALALRDEDAAVRSRAAAVLEKHSDARLAGRLRDALRDPDATVRRCALRALVASGAEWHDGARSLLGDEDGAVAQGALRLLAQAGALAAEEIAPLLLHPDGSTRVSAAQTLRERPGLVALEALLPCLADASSGMQIAALQALAPSLIALDLGAEQVDRVVAALAPIITGSPDTTVIGNALTQLSLVAPRHPGGLDLLVGATRDPRPFVRSDAARVLGEIGGARAVAALEAMVGDGALPREAMRSSSFTVGETARRALERARRLPEGS